MPKVEKNEANLGKCLCPGCPTYTDCAKDKNEKLYCAIGKTGCPFEKKGCLCGGCAVFAENNLKTGYYCVNGSAEEIEKA